MGVLSDAFIATDAEFATVDWTKPGRPEQFFPAYQSKNVDPLLLEQLEALLLGKHFSGDMLDERIIGTQDETLNLFFYRFPPEMVQVLANLTAPEILHYGVLWASIEEDAWSGMAGIDAALHYLREICQLARSAQAEGKLIYMWYCL